VTVDTSGNAYVANFMDSTVQKFNSASGLSMWIAASGVSPTRLAVDSSGSIYVASYGSGIQKFYQPVNCTSTRYPGGWVSFTDPTITAGSTQIRVTHVTDLRTDINLMRADAGLGACAWTDPTLTASSTQIRKVHFDEMRACISAVYTTCGSAAPTFTDATITARSTQIRATHLNELRTATLNAP
jgi:hypothetical protein